ncbi:MAG: glycosyltransferase [Azonexus sp.]|jgi:processive 1,2-diacylglycerol beta-glucosyltransferase|uniref:MGDG synthase family glycosyltransferase n=1 Tax=Azonexus sp. TaxID=1872668 RepID=UPI00283939A1|nr:glycosyltransferase [Azonexus sp.]MDR0775176.1 glycosyltransferase [Azonexus sp.]
MSAAKKILLLSVSAGAGHMRAAEALHQCAQRQFPEARTLHLDVMQYVTAAFRKIYTSGYMKLVTASPTMWRLLYEKSDEADPRSPMQKLRRASERLNTKALLRAVKEFAPDAVICTHFLPAELLMHEIRRQRINLPVWVQVTDFDLHRMWIMPRMTGYFAANEEIAARMRQLIEPSAQIHCTGIPIMPAFGDAPDALAARQQFGLDPSRSMVLLMGGGAGMGGLDEVARALLAIEHDFQLVVLAGKNQETLQALQTLAAQHPGRLIPLGFTDQVHRLLACASFVVTKPGGLSTSESLALGVPMIVNSPIPGQEERNADYLLEQGAALKAVDEIALAWRVRRLLSEPGLLDAMRERAAALGRPQAARDVLRVVLGQLA